MKKKILACFLAALSIFVFAACEKDVEEPEETGKGSGMSLADVFQKNETKEEKKQEAQEEAADILPQKTADEKRALNIFLSNFAETGYLKGEMPYTGDEGKIDFAFTHLLINAQSRLAAVPDYDAVSAAEVDKVLEKYFGSSVPHKTPKDSRKWTYVDGNFIARIPGGDSYGDFAVATSMKKLQDGNFEVTFHIYSHPDAYGGNIVNDPTLYSLTDSDAAASYSRQAKGTAVIKEKVYNGKETYELVSYDVTYNN